MKSSAAAVNAAVAALFFARAVVGQAGNCEVATSEGYDFMVSSEEEAWAAVGFSEDGQMIGTDAVIYLPATEDVAEYGLDAKSLAGVTLTAVSDIEVTSFEQDASTTTFAFTRKLTPDAGDDEKLVIPEEEGTEIYIAWAYGMDNTLAVHAPDARSSFLVDVFCPTASGVTDEQSSTPAPIAMTSAPTLNPASDVLDATDGAGRAGAGVGGTAVTSAAMTVCLGALWARGP